MIRVACLFRLVALDEMALLLLFFVFFFLVFSILLDFLPL
jgi:hypothetical protein